MYKVASFDVVNRRLLSDVAHTGKPVLLSVGMASHEEIEAAYAVLRAGTDKVALLHCISAYPTREDAANLAAIFTLQDAFDCVIGHSDHTPDIHVPLYAAAAGAQVIEKHFKLDDNMECIDAPVSITEEQMRCMVAEVRRLERLFGRGELGVREVEKDITIFRRFSEK